MLSAILYFLYSPGGILAIGRCQELRFRPQLNKPQISVRLQSLSRHLRILIVSLAILIWLESGDVFTNSAQKRGRSSGNEEAKSPVFRNTATGIEYVGSQVCSKCHSEIFQSYIQTGMGRSMSAANSHLEKAPSPFTLVNPVLKRYFQVFREGTDLYQSEYELDADGKEVFRHTQKLVYAIGSGANGFSYIVRRGDHLFQAPLSYYSRAQAWGFSPGYETADHGFGRPIQAGCIQCHSGRPRAVPGRNGLYLDPPFDELAIGCENCHGPGALHVQERRKGLRISSLGDTSIVNPRRLPARMADNICMNCHQRGDARILQPGKDYFDFRPGKPLNETVAIFKLPLRKEDSPHETDLLEHYSQMTLSRCYRESNGRLSCLSCHNPHYQPAAKDAPAYYRNKCMTCHTNASCDLPLEKRLKQDPPNNCIGCHLPQRRLREIAHSALSNHRIIARPGQPLPDAAFQPPGASSPDLAHVNAPARALAGSLPPMTLLQAYGELLGARPEYEKRYLTLLDQVAAVKPDDGLVLSALARKAKLEDTPEGRAKALAYLSRAIERGSTTASDYQDYAELLADQGKTAEAIKILQKGIEIAPYTGTLYKSLALRYITIKDYPAALATMKKHLELFPEDSLMRKLVRQVEVSR
jgi:hypothetical protein